MAKRQILIVENDKIVADDIQQCLESLGYGVSAIANSREEAINKVAKTQPDLVLMDIKLNGDMGGLKAAKQIRTQFNIPIIYLTAYADKNTLKRAMATEPYGYILKPFQLEELSSTLKSAFHKHKIEKQFSEGKITKKTLKNSEGLYRLLFDSAPDGMNVLDKEGNIIDCNKSEELLCGYTRDELVGKHITSLMSAVSVKIFSEMFQLLKQLKPIEGEIQIVRSDGKTVEVWCKSIPLIDEKSNVSGLLVYNRDITERKRIEQQLIQSQKMDTIGRLSAGVAHDFNNILSAITDFSNLIMSQLDVNNPISGQIEEIKKASDWGTSLARQLLAFSRKQVIQPKIVDLNSILLQRKEMLQYLIGKDIEMDLFLQPETGHVKADPGQIEQVVMNLIVNARDAMPDGGKLTIKTEKLTLTEKDCEFDPKAYPGEFACLTVNDTGAGIDDTIIPQIFDPFFTTKKSGEGTGLGLSTVYGIVKQHNGWIDIDSEPGKGSTFRVYLPTNNIIARLQESPENNERILVLEDEDMVREVTSSILRENGYIVFEADSLYEAQYIFKKENGKFDLIISDIILHDEAGSEIIEDFLSKNHELQVLLNSGYYDQHTKWATINNKKFRFIEKPYKATDLLQTVQDILKQADQKEKQFAALQELSFAN